MSEAQHERAGRKPARKAPPKGRAASGGKSRKGRKSAPPITAHPLFPAIVALWFAAAFGLGSLAIRPSLLEGVVLALGIDTIIPAAAPPLGVTARMLLALGLGAFGAVLGTLLARRLNRPKVEEKPRARKVGAADAPAAPRSRDAHPDAPARRPILAHEELGADDLAEPLFAPARSAAQPLPGRRRALAIEDEGPRTYHDLAPLPGAEPQVLDIGAFALDDDAPFAPQQENEAALDLAAFAPPPAPFAPPAEAPLQSFAPPPADFGSVRLGPAQADGTAVPIAAAAEDLPRVPEPAAVPMARFDRPGGAPGGVFDIPAQAPRLFGRPADDEQPLAEVVIAPPAASDEDETPEPVAAEAPAAAPAGFVLPEGPAAARLHGAALDDLSHVELIERLALSLKRRRDADGATAAEAPAIAPPAAEAVEAPAPAPLVLPAFSAPAAPAETAPAAKAPEPALPTLPAALRPLSFDEPVHDEAEDFTFLPPRHLAMAPEPEPELTPEPEAEPVAAEAEAEDGPYSSLLDLKLTPAQPRGGFVRIEEPEANSLGVEPVVIFPGHGTPAPAETGESAPVLRRFDAPGAPGVPSQTMATNPAPRDPEETERALRAALASLQRMSGAA